MMHKLEIGLERALSDVERIYQESAFKPNPPSLAQHLFYEEVLEGERPIQVLRDGSLGVMWEIDPLCHETMGLSELNLICEQLARALGDIRHPEASLQVIWDSEPSRGIEGLSPGDTSAQRILAERLRRVADLGKNPRENLTLMKRRVYVTLRLGRGESLAVTFSNEAERVKRRNQEHMDQLCSLARELEYGLSHAGLTLTILGGADILSHVQAVLHDQEVRSYQSLPSYSPGRALNKSLLSDFVSLTSHGIGVGQDTWEVASWADQPPATYAGIFSRLLEMDHPMRVVVCLRPCFSKSDLEQKSFFLRHAEDPAGELQREDVKETLEAMVRGDPLFYVSLHLLVRGVQKTPDQVKKSRTMLEILSKLKTLTQIPWVHERFAAPVIFLTALPFGYGKKSGDFTGREKRVLARNLGSYLPLYGSWRGTKKSMQLMVSRGGELAGISPFASETSPHMAILGSSGGGKSFFGQNLMMSFFATHQDPLLFIIDKKTSYEILTRVIGEDHGAQIVKPPAHYPNLFQGRLDRERLATMVGILKTALSLVSPGLILGANEDMLIADAIRLSFEQCELDCRTSYEGGILGEKDPTQVRIPRLSDVKNNLFPAASASGMGIETAQKISQSMAPFLGQGPYAHLFDREEYEAFDPPTPGVCLYDLDGVAGNPVLSTLSTQMILSEILRQILRPENRGRPGMLVIEEAGVLSGGSPEIVSFIQDAWKTFRKLGIACVGLSNEVDDFRLKPGPREIWNVSPNKVILKMTAKDLEKAASPEGDLPALIGDRHLVSLIGSLTKRDGVYSQGVFLSDETRGSFVYMPTGYDYWCAASKPLEVQTVYQVAECLKGEKKPFFKALDWLSQRFPNGVRTPQGELRSLSADELGGGVP